MNSSANLKAFVAGLMAVTMAGCALEPSSRDVAPAAAPSPGYIPMKDPPDTAEAKLGSAIDSIVYSDIPREQMLKQLSPFLQSIGTKQDFDSRETKGLSFCVGSGPGVMSCSVPYCGIDLVFDPDGVLRVVRRSSGTVGGRYFPAMSVTEPGFEWHGYRRWYAD